MTDLFDGPDALESAAGAGENTVEAAVGDGNAGNTGGQVPADVASERAREEGIRARAGLGGIEFRPVALVPDPALAQLLIERFDRRGQDYFFRGTERKAFSDRGGRLTSRLEDRETVDGMLCCAEITGWRFVVVKGSESFRRQAWYAARQRGLAVSGYEPTREEAALFPSNSADQSLAKSARQHENAIEPTASSGGAGAPNKPLSPEAERAGVMDPTRVQASLDVARKQIADALGDKAQVFRAETRSGSYRGELIGETQLHVIQRISGRMAVIHDKADVAGGIIGQRGVYAYRGGRAQFAANREQQLMKAGLER